MSRNALDLQEICCGGHFTNVAKCDTSHNFSTFLKMFKTILIASLACSAVAFRPAPMARASLSKLSMNAEGLAGESGPLGYFDPLG